MRLIAAAAPLPDLLEFAEAASQIGDQLIEEHTQWRRERRQAREERHIHFDDNVDRAAQTCQLLSTLVGAVPGDEPLPVVLILDDAHNLDNAGASFVSHILAADIPALIIATTWPDRLSSPRPDPFSALISEIGSSEQITSITLNALLTEDLIDYVQRRFPGTDPQIAARLAERAGRNPYALQLLLDTPRVRGVTREGRIGLRADEVDELNGGLDSLLGQHWAELSLGVRQVLVAAALLGESFIDDVLVAGLGRVRAMEGVDAALASSWIRSTGGTPGMLEFVERMRFEIARASAADVLSSEDRIRILSGALSAVRAHLRDNQFGDARHVLLTLHVTLAGAGVEADLATAAASARQLADRARSEHRRHEALRYLTQAAAWLEPPAPHHVSQLIQTYIDLSTVQRILGDRRDGESVARRVVELADTYLASDDEIRISARCCLARCLRNREEVEDYHVCLDLAKTAEEMVTELPNPSFAVIRDVLSLKSGIQGNQGDYGGALATMRILLARCENDCGRLHRWTLNALGDIGYYSLRAGLIDDAIVARRQQLVRRTEQINQFGYLQTIATRNNLAAVLLAANDDRFLDEVEQLVNEAYSGWCRLYGIDGLPTQRARLVRARLWQRQGLQRESAGLDAVELFERAAAETAQIVELRRDRPAGSRASALMRHGASLACLQDPEAIGHLQESLRIRTEELRQDHTFWQVTDCATALRWTYQRLGRRTEAEAVNRLYRLTGER